MERGERIGGAQQHQRIVSSLNKHVQLTTDKIKEVRVVKYNFEI